MNRLIFYLFMAFIVSGCRNAKNKPCNMSNYENTDSSTYVYEALDSMAKKFESKGYIEFPFNLESNSDFVYIQSNSCKFNTALLAILRDQTKDKLVKQLALYELQLLCIEDYMIVLELVYEEFRKGNSDEEFLMKAISQEGFSFEIAKNYNNERLREILIKISGDMKSSTNKSVVANILSGTTWGRSGEIEGKRWTCD